MDLELKSALPIGLQDSVLCHAFVHYLSNYTDPAPEVAICCSNGYLYEVKNRKILNCLNIRNETFSSLSCYYLFDDDQIVLFYLLFTHENNLFFIRRKRKLLEVEKTIKNVKEFEVSDFDSVGYPQVKVTFIDSQSKIIDFLDDSKQQPVNILTDDSADDDDNHEKDDNESSNGIIKALVERLQMIKLHVNKLNEENDQLKRICIGQGSSQTCDSHVRPISTVRFSSPLEIDPQPEVSVCNTWLKFMGSHTMLGITIQNKSRMEIPDVTLILINENIKKYFWQCFAIPENVTLDSFWPSTIAATIKPGKGIVVVGAFPTPPFVTESKQNVRYSLNSSAFDRCLTRGEVELEVLEVATRHSLDFEKGFSVEDLMAVITWKKEKKLTVRIERENRNLVVNFLREKLGFKKIPNLKDEIFYCTSSLLNEVFVYSKMISVHPAVWKIRLYTSNDEAVNFLIRAMYDFLPDNTKISKEDEDDGR